jgi:hypothetical protein
VNAILTLFITGQKIPIDAIDAFWTKLDFKPAYIDNEEELDVVKDMDLVTKQILVQPKPV